MKEIRANWYEYPHLYDIAFGWSPDVEVDFLEAAWQRFGNGAVNCVYEPFCGTGRIAIELARRGYDVTGLDLVPGAVEYARARAADAGVALQLRVGDVTHWTCDQPVDAIPILIDSFRHLAAPGLAEQALARFAEMLRPGGLLIIGLDVGEPDLEVSDEEMWTMERDGITIETAVFDTRAPGPDPETTIVRAVLLVDGDGDPYSITTDDAMRTYTRDRFPDMVTAGGGFELCGTFDRRYDLDQPKHPNSKALDAVYVFRRTD